MQWQWTYGDDVVTMSVECLGYKAPWSPVPRAQWRVTIDVAGEAFDIDGLETPHFGRGDDEEDRRALAAACDFYQAATEDTDSDLGRAFAPVVAALRARGVPLDYVLSDLDYDEVIDDE
jgi:hypothetical protein